MTSGSSAGQGYEPRDEQALSTPPHASTQPHDRKLDPAKYATYTSCMTEVLTVRLDEPTAKAFDEIQDQSGLTRSDLVRKLVIEERRRMLDGELRSESGRLMADPVDAAEMQRISTEMQTLRDW